MPREDWALALIIIFLAAQFGLGMAIALSHILPHHG